MSKIESHIKQWIHNRKFIETIPPQYNDWIVTASFYTALHAVDCLLIYDQVRVESHQARNAALKRTNRYEKICKNYLPLYFLSRTVRYLANPQGWMPFEKTERELFINRLYPIEKSVQKLVKEDLGLEKIQLQKP